MIQPFPTKLNLWILLFEGPKYSGGIPVRETVYHLPFIAFSYLNVLSRTCHSVSNRSDKMDIIVFFQFQHFPFRILAVNFIKIGGYYVINYIPNVLSFCLAYSVTDFNWFSLLIHYWTVHIFFLHNSILVHCSTHELLHLSKILHNSQGCIHVSPSPIWNRI